MIAELTLLLSVCVKQFVERTDHCLLVFLHPIELLQFFLHPVELLQYCNKFISSYILLHCALASLIRLLSYY